MIKRAAFQERCQHYEARIETAENKYRLLKQGLKWTETCIHYALIESDPGVKQWLLWQLVHALRMNESEIDMDMGTEPAPSHPIWIEFTELTEGPKQPQPFLIREEEHPLKQDSSIFRVYAENMQPLYIGRETVEEAEIELRQHERVSQVTVIYREDESLLALGFRVYQSCGYYYPQRRIGDCWRYFPANGPLLTPEIASAKWFKRRDNAVKYLQHYIASEQAAWESGLFDGIPTMKVYDYSEVETSR